MKNKICKCGHEDGMHSGTKGCLYVLHRYPNLKFDDYCPCKKFEPQEVCKCANQKIKNFKKYGKVCEHCKKPKNHSPSEEKAGTAESSGGDSPKICPKTHSGDTLTSKILRASKEHWVDVVPLEDIKDFIKKLKEGDKTFIQHIQNHLKEDEKVVCRICNKTAEEIVGNYTNLNELAGEDLLK